MPARLCFHHRNRQLPVFLSDIQMRGFTLFLNVVADFPVTNKTGDGFRVGFFIGQILPPVITQHFRQRRFILAYHCRGK
ncbi:hypothetical protein D3C75_546130 [compost metagenome]